MCATWAENPHIGAALLPFMNKTTSLLATVLRIQSWTACSLMNSSPFQCRREDHDAPQGGLGAAWCPACLAGQDVGKPRMKSMFGDGGGERQRVQRAAHVALQGVVDHLVLLHPCLARELLGHDAGGIMVAIPREVGDGHLGVGKADLDEPLDLLRIHGHGKKLCQRSAR